jgi:hypothetical protein
MVLRRAIDYVKIVAPRKFLMEYGRRSAFALIGLGLAGGSGCGLDPSWPYVVDLSGFTEFHKKRMPPCQDEFDLLVTNYVCEATIVRRDSGDYVFQGSYIGPTDVVEVLPRTLTEAEVTTMLAVFADLHYDRADQLFCHDPLPGGTGSDTFLRWDDREFITYGCGQPRIFFGEVRQIDDFLSAFVLNN